MVNIINGTQKWGNYLDTRGGTCSGGLIRMNGDDGQTVSTSTGESNGLQVFQATAGADALMSFHVGGDYACYFGLSGATNDLVVGGWSKGTTPYKVWHEGNSHDHSNYIINNADDSFSGTLTRTTSGNTMERVLNVGSTASGIFKYSGQRSLCFHSDSSTMLFAGDSPSKVLTGLGYYEDASHSEDAIIACDNTVRIFAGQQSGYNTAYQATLSATGLFTAPTISATTFNGMPIVSGSATANSLVARTSTGDVHGRMFRSTYANQSTISGGIVFRVNNSSDNYNRVCSSPTAIKNWLGVGGVTQKATRTSTGTWSITGLTTGKPVFILASGSGYAQARPSSGGIPSNAKCGFSPDNYNNPNTMIFIATSTTLKLSISGISSCTLYAYQ